MEKIVTVLWKPEGQSDAEHGKRLRELAPKLAGLGARKVRVNVVDEHVAAADPSVRVGQMDPPKSAVVSFWLDMADDLRGPLLAALAAEASRVVAFLVVESIPTHPNWEAGPGARSPGFNLVTCIEPKEGLPYADFIEHWHGEHRVVAVETQSTTAYVRNEIVRALTPDAPSWAAIVEESFPIEAIDDPSVWYAAKGDPELLEKNRGRMIQSCLAFLAMERVESHPMSEYVY